MENTFNLLSGIWSSLIDVTSGITSFLGRTVGIEEIGLSFTVYEGLFGGALFAILFVLIVYAFIP